jgi:exodeoxyribonuclease VII small subunit
MKNEMTYSASFEKLEELVEQLEQGDIQLDQLTSKVKMANELIAVCEAKLRKIEKEVNEAIKITKDKQKRGKKGSE